MDDQSPRSRPALGPGAAVAPRHPRGVPRPGGPVNRSAAPQAGLVRDASREEPRSPARRPGRTDPARRPRWQLIGCLIADGESIVRTGLRSIIEAEPELAVVAEAGDGEEAVRAAGISRPNVVLLATRIPGMDPEDVTREILERARAGGDRPPAVIVLSGATPWGADDGTAAACLRAGARGYVSRTASPHALLSAVHAAVRGHTVVTPALAQRLVSGGATPGLPSPAPGLARGPLGRSLRVLSPRERQILAALASGRSNRELAADFGLREATVKSHVSSLLTKLGLRSRSEAVALAFRTGLVSARRDDVAARGR